MTKDNWRFAIKGLPEGTYDLAVMCYEVPYISRIGYFIDRSSVDMDVVSDEISNRLFNCIERYTEARNTALSELNEDSVKSSDTVTDDYFDRETELENGPFSNARHRNRAIAELAKPNGKITAANEERCVLEVYGSETTVYAFCLVNLRSILRDLDLEVDNFVFERLDLVLQNGDWKIKSRDDVENDIFAPSKNGPYVYHGYVCFELSGSLVGLRVGPDTGNIVLSHPIELLPVTTIHNHQWIGKRVKQGDG